VPGGCDRRAHRRNYVTLAANLSPVDPIVIETGANFVDNLKEHPKLDAIKSTWGRPDIEVWTARQWMRAEEVQPEERRTESVPKSSHFAIRPG
jgi:hypothetical protein